MSFSRYLYNRTVKSGKGYATSENMFKIHRGVELGIIAYSTYVLEEGQRLDQLAGAFYKSSSYWWIIAAASGIGWGLQVPPGTLIKIPKNINEVLSIIS